MTTQQQQEASYKEGRIALAIQAYQLGQFQALQPATISFDVPRSTTRDRLKGIQPKRGSRAKNRLLTTTEEETLVQWILLMDRRGMSLRPQAVG
jgi:hypothetical protein